MSCNWLFQIIDPNAGQAGTKVTFQKQDRVFIDKQKPMLEQEIQAVLEEGESQHVFPYEEEGIWFGGHVCKRNGKPITLRVPNKADLDYIKHAESMVNNPPKKRFFFITFLLQMYHDLPLKSPIVAYFNHKGLK